MKESHGFCKVYIILCFMTVYCESILKCDTEDCRAKYGDPPKVLCMDTPEDAKIKSVNILKEKGRNKCVFNETYGFDVYSVWVSPPCNALFNVCFIIESDDDTTKSPTIRIYTSRSPTLDGSTTDAFSDLSTRSPKEMSSASNPEHGGIIGGVIGGLVVLIIVVTSVLLIIRRITWCKNRYRKNHSDQNGSGHRNVTCSKSQETTVNNEDIYDTLELYQDTHQYQRCESVSGVQQPTYMTIYDSLSPEEEYLERSQDQKDRHKSQSNTSTADFNFRKDGINNESGIPSVAGQYSVLDPSETGFCKGEPVIPLHNVG